MEISSEAFRSKIDETLTHPEVRRIRDRNLALWAQEGNQIFSTLLSDWEGEIKKKMDRLRGIDENPMISIVIPARNEEKNILQILDSISSQKLKDTLEVIIVDNNSSPNDRTEEIAKACGARIIKYTLEDDNPDKGLSQIALARQKGLRQASGKYIISTDADGIATDRWVEKMIEPLKGDTTITCTTGHVINYDRKNALFAVPLDAATMIGRPIANKTKIRANVVTLGANTAFRKSDALEIGGYDERKYPGEDTDIGIRLSKIGGIKFITGYEAAVRVSSRRLSQGGLVDTLRHYAEINKSLYKSAEGDPRNFR